MTIPGLGTDAADALIAYRLSVGGDTAGDGSGGDESGGEWEDEASVSESSGVLA
jgi:hypothetical protein